MKEKKFEIGNQVYIHGKQEAKKFLPSEELRIYSDIIKFEGKERLRQVINLGGGVKWIKQKYLRKK
ncbi:MAG: hypothetical protein HFE46_05490 [Clostridia bacterium]|jgi:hypothetical protein|nr:hypothetical protein [Clostridia bacterium]